MLLVNNYLNLITSEHRMKPKYVSMLENVFEMYSDESSALDDVNYRMDIDDAIGDQLDILGEYIGQSRVLNVEITGASSTLGDEDYRFLLKSKIAQNNWKGTIEELYDIWEEMFPDIELIVYDNQDMTCTLLIIGSMTSIQIQLLLLDFLIPKPCGVKYNYTFVSRTLFAYDLDNERYAGYNTGYWEGDFTLFAFDIASGDSVVFDGLDLGSWS